MDHEITLNKSHFLRCNDTLDKGFRADSKFDIVSLVHEDFGWILVVARLIQHYMSIVNLHENLTRVTARLSGTQELPPPSYEQVSRCQL